MKATRVFFIFFHFLGTMIYFAQSSNITPTGNETVLLGKQAEFECSVKSPNNAAEIEMWWQFQNQNVSNSDRFQISVSKSADGNVLTKLKISSVQWEDAGLYSCVAREIRQTASKESPPKQNIMFNVLAAPKQNLGENGKGEVGKDAEMACSFKGKPLPQIKWLRFGNPIEEDEAKYEISTERKSDKEIKSYLKILRLHHDDNGTFLCHGENEYGSDVAIIENFVLDKPEVDINFAKGVGKNMIYFNWTVTEWNADVTDYFLSYRKSGGDSWVYFISEKIPKDANSFVMKDLQEDSEYHIKLGAKNKFGTGAFDMYHETVKTLDYDPVFVPDISIKGNTWNSISIGWSTPNDEKIKNYINYYKLTKKSPDGQVNMYQSSKKYSFYLWRHLEPATNYSFTVSACNDYTRECGEPSKPLFSVTEDGLSGPPSNVEIYCRHVNISSMNYVEVSWEEPIKKHGHIEFYNIQLRGVANYINKEGKLSVDLFGPEVKNEDSASRKTRFDFLKANTNYTVEVCAVTRRKECGKVTSVSCKMRQTPPRAEHLNQFQWYSDAKSGHPVFRLRMPKLSERNGRICCLRVIVVKLKQGQSASDLPHQSQLVVSSYRKVHQSKESWGAYISEILGSNFMGKDVLVGDGQNILSAHMGGCPACRTGVRAHLLQAVRKAEEKQRYARSTALIEPTELVEDGFLDPDANYTAFVELIIPDSNLVGRSPYMSPRRPGEPISLESGSVNTILVSVIGILAGLVFVALSLLLALMLLRRYSKRVAASQGGVEMNLRRSLRHLCSTLRGRDHSQYLITPEAPKSDDAVPIKKDCLVQEYLSRHKDSDYGFQAEFEMLPDRFSDRTTENCDKAHNRQKNRYPDIKCYDQTRVTLNEIEEKEGSDYINANYVVGYKERKRWICAQGPLEHTVADFWRMIYEKGVEIIIMLTNLEEYNRVKCAQYWPQAGDSNYCTQPVIINVCFCTERRYSDYIVRELKMTITKGENIEKEVKTIYHYHYLQWKDFNAPEHAPGMLKFSKRLNEAWNGKNPMVVHCSAGVGRSGTLIAIDSLIQQLNEEQEVTIFQTVCELRHQRNYLVQSVKQYMFVYRAIMEMAQFGDTEMEASKVKETSLKLMNDSSKLEEEFSRLSNIVDDRKALSVGTNDENKVKNQSDQVIPYDRNRVILTPDGIKPHSTYINASFIEGYHNDESFIITQDPLPSTAEDFWRMVTEHNIATMVMLSAEKAWQYWEEEREANFGALKVTLNSTEKLPSYVKREFTVENTKAEEEVTLTHFAYNSWSGDEATDLPSKTHGLLDLVEHAAAHKVEASLPGPIAVHCQFGSHRSSVYVALSCLVQQVKNEQRADVFTVVRKLRSQRQQMIQSLNQYKFIYRAISDYIDLYLSKDEEYEYSVPINAVNGNLKK